MHLSPIYKTSLPVQDWDNVIVGQDNPHKVTCHKLSWHFFTVVSQWNGDKVQGRMSLQSVCQCNEQLLSELIKALKALPSSSYQEKVLTDNSQTIGAHVRHIIEFYQCFFAGLENKQISYDERKRDAEYEVNLALALRTLLYITHQLTSLANTPLISINLALSATIDTNGSTISLESSLIRELLFLQSHTTHHMALINLLFQVSGNEPSKDLGLSISTLIYRKQQVMPSD